MEQEKSCCFTGHRPEKLPWGTNELDKRCLELKARLEDAVQQAYKAGMRHFICGMAKGTDLYFAETVLRLRAVYEGITLEAARPCQTQAQGWSEEEQCRYQEILEQCDYETLVQHSYDRGSMWRRNRYMVDRSSMVIAAYNGDPKGGTAQTLAYAMSKGIKTIILDVEEGSR